MFDSPPNSFFDAVCRSLVCADLVRINSLDVTAMRGSVAQRYTHHSSLSHPELCNVASLPDGTTNRKILKMHRFHTGGMVSAAAGPRKLSRTTHTFDP